MKEAKLKALLDVVIEHYIDKWEPIGSKFLHSLEETDYAPSTLRKYLNILEQDGLLYQPYKSAWRIPTVQWLEAYLDGLIALPKDVQEEQISHVPDDVVSARDDLRSVTSTLWKYADGAVVGFLKEDEYFYLWINNLLRDSFLPDVETTKYLIKFIESKKLIQELDKKMIKRDQIYYTFIEADEKLISIVYTKLEINGYDAIISILGPSRVDHRKNVAILRQFVNG
jgi:transcriptional regulator of heat shock response